ncbi:MAG: cytochrome c [Bdellovibrionales bacterium]|nr:cytochrome c [Bdellovibrionales bacterium]
MRTKIALSVLLGLLISSVSFAEVDAAKLFKKKCVSCHGKQGEGKKSQKAPRIGGQYEWYIESQINDIKSKKRTNGSTKKMVTFVKKLKDEEIKALSKYIAGLEWKASK